MTSSLFPHVRHAAFMLCALCFASPALTQSPAPPAAPATAWPAAEWDRATPEEMGMDSRALASLVEYGGNVKMDSVFVTRWGRAVLEAYYAPFAERMKHRVNSSTKAVTGTLVGIAAAQGLLDANAPVTGFFKDRHIAALDDAKRAITVQQLLDMVSGLDWNEPLTDEVPRSLIEMERSRDWQQFTLDRPMAQPAGTTFNYNSGNSQLASAIVARAAGTPTRDFAAKHLFAPIGISEFRWREDPQGVSTGGLGLYLHPADMARFGLLYLHHGNWNGTQVVPRAWADKMLNAKVRMFPTGDWVYADGWWTLPRRKAYLTVGYNRQLVVVLPELGIVAAVTGRGPYPMENLIDHLVRAAKAPAALPRDADGLAQLQARISEAAAGKPLFPVAPPPPAAREVDGRTFTFAPNEGGWKELTLRLGDKPGLELVAYTSRDSNATQKVSLPLGMDGRFAMGQTPEGITAMQAGWTDATTLAIALRVPEEAIERAYELRFSGSRVAVTLTNSFGRKLAFNGEAR
jgi:CubicO group peptidase (beta-lactamase class C family)